LAKQPLRQRVDVVLVAVFADAKRDDMDDHRLLIELIDNAIALPNRADGVITGEFVSERLTASLRFLPEIVNARSNHPLHPRVSDRAKMCPRFGGKDDLPR
jgi:hypothetical protein